LTNEVQNAQALISENVIPIENKQLKIQNTNIKDGKDQLICFNGEIQNGESLPIEDTTTSTKNEPRVTVNNDAKFKCELCHYEAPSNSDLNTHINFIHNEYVDYKCDRCDYKAARPSNLQHHIQVIHGMKHHCKHCKYETPTISELNSHVNFSHETKNAKVSMFKCNKCVYETNNAGNFLRHETYHQHKWHSCSKCEFQTQSSALLKEHMKDEHSRKLKEKKKAGRRKPSGVKINLW